MQSSGRLDNDGTVLIGEYFVGAYGHTFSAIDAGCPGNIRSPRYVTTIEVFEGKKQ
jgi:hypothetical protein